MKIITIFIIFLILVGCKESNESSHILLLKVDYTTYAFEGGKEIPISDDVAGADTIPIDLDYNAPGDFGDVTLYYKPTNEMIFSGEIIWMGLGEISFPRSFDPADSYSQLNLPIEKPENSMFQYIPNGSGINTVAYDSVWIGIQNLKIVQKYMNSGKKIGFFIYTPSVGAGNPADWDYLVIMNK
ncbi:MAG: hypothetical protein C0599_01840 [Salinivirgaceae bacterium]|nr:MAG: hypothetical protein C0599_01840 [Salinivirgaceae bacterium]